MIKRGDLEDLEQLALELDLPAPEEEAGLDPEEVRRISLAAEQALDHLVAEKKTVVTSSPPGSHDPTPQASGTRPGTALMRADPASACGGWLVDYLRLKELGYSWRVAAYIAWEASPKGERMPPTITALATEVLGLKSPRVIYTWRKRNPTIDEVVSVMQTAPLFAHRRDVIEALISVAADPDYKAHKDRKLFFEMLGDYTPRKEVDVSDHRAKPDDLSQLSDEELRERAEMLKEDAPTSHEVGAAVDALTASHLDPPSGEAPRES